MTICRKYLLSFSLNLNIIFYVSCWNEHQKLNEIKEVVLCSCFQFAEVLLSFMWLLVSFANVTFARREQQSANRLCQSNRLS